MLRFTKKEVEELNRSQNATGSQSTVTHVFHPMPLLNMVRPCWLTFLKSTTAVDTSILVVRVFIRMRQLLASQKGLMQKILVMEKKYDEKFKLVFRAIYQLMEEEEKPKSQIGFTTKSEESIAHCV